METSLAFFVLLIQLANALILDQTSCPDVEPVENFNISSFVNGVWYELGRYNNDVQNGSNCIAHKGQRQKSGLYKIVTADVPVTSPLYVETNVALKDNSSNIGDLVLTFGESMKFQKLGLKVLLYDTKKYAVTYGCKYDEQEKVAKEYAWVLVRSRRPSRGVNATLTEFIKSSNVLQTDKFEWFNPLYNGCRINKHSA